MEDPLILGGVFTVVGSAIMLLSKMLDKLPQFRNGDHKALSDIAKSLEPIRDVICGDYSRRESGTFKIHNLPEVEKATLETKEMAAKSLDILEEATGTKRKAL